MLAAWLDSLESPDGRRFMDRANLEGYGFVFDDRPSKANPYSWPIGIALDADPRNGGIDQAGLTCAACHTAQIEYSGRKLRIDGGARPTSTSAGSRSASTRRSSPPAPRRKAAPASGSARWRAAIRPRGWMPTSTPPMPMRCGRRRTRPLSCTA